MITSAKEFISLRTSDSEEDQYRATHDDAEMMTWHDVIQKYPDFKIWVIHNKTIQIEILEKLAEDPDPEVREAVARKRKINDKIFELLSVDKVVSVRYALLSNTKLPVPKLKQIRVDDSGWLKEQLNKKLHSASFKTS